MRGKDLLLFLMQKGAHTFCQLRFGKIGFNQAAFQLQFLSLKWQNLTQFCFCRHRLALSLLCSPKSSLFGSTKFMDSNTNLCHLWKKPINSHSKLHPNQLHHSWLFSKITVDFLVFSSIHWNYMILPEWRYLCLQRLWEHNGAPRDLC